MNQIHVNPEKLREFARLLKGFSHFAEASLANLNWQLARLHNTWRDQEFDKFAASVRKTQARLKAFSAETAKTVPALERDAEAMTEYQKLQTPQ